MLLGVLENSSAHATKGIIVHSVLWLHLIPVSIIYRRNNSTHVVCINILRRGGGATAQN